MAIFKSDAAKEAARHAELPLPTGQRIGNVRHVTGLLLKYGVPGVSHEQGRERNIAAYAAFVDALKQKAADQAFAAWLEANKGANDVH